MTRGERLLIIGRVHSVSGAVEGFSEAVIGIDGTFLAF
jgi:hypothetical protein